VLPVGGIKEKVLAAHRNGLSTIILPKRNELDLDDIPEEVKKSMKFIFVDTVDEVLKAALEKKAAGHGNGTAVSGSGKRLKKSSRVKKADGKGSNR
jgi:ATP-dependent Lon protease